MSLTLQETWSGCSNLRTPAVVPGTLQDAEWRRNDLEAIEDWGPIMNLHPPPVSDEDAHAPH
jgi:hypothetical protein